MSLFHRNPKTANPVSSSWDWTNPAQSGSSFEPSIPRDGYNAYEVIVKQLQAQLQDLQKACAKSRAETGTARECLRTVAEKVCSQQYSQEQLGKENTFLNMRDTELRDFVLNDFLAQKKEFSDRIQQALRRVQEAEARKQNTAQQLLRMQEDYAHLQSEYAALRANYTALQAKWDTLSCQSEIQSEPSGSNLNPLVQTASPSTHEDVSNPKHPASNPPSETAPVRRADETTSPLPEPYVDQDGTVINFEQIEQGLSLTQKHLFEQIGQWGLNEQKEIIEAAEAQGDFGKSSNIRKLIKELENMRLLGSETVSTALRPTTTLYFLSEAGQIIYPVWFQQAPQMDERSRILGMHTTLEHGYLIKDIADELEKQGYADVCMDAVQNRIPVATGSFYEPDITAKLIRGQQRDDRGQLIHPGKPVKTVWEVELGHHHDRDMIDKLQRASLVVSQLTIVVNKMETKTTLIQQVQQFFQQQIALQTQTNLEIWVCTAKELKDRTYRDNPGNRFTLPQQKQKQSPKSESGAPASRPNRTDSLSKNIMKAKPVAIVPDSTKVPKS